ncbi:MAG: BTAD domain-containing putative transcriptional regulator [Lachnospira sp.]|nr:BTAD domain-containing putative transcriptional regulator [Lachnospira sp.]
MSELSMNHLDTIQVRLFGTFCMSSECSVVDERDLNSEKAVKLLAYMISHHKNAVTHQELASAVWEEAENDNPAGAMKNMVYRTRNMLKKAFGNQEFICSGRGYYKWNEQIRIQLDVEEFEELCRKEKTEKDILKKIQYGFQAYELYRGKYMENYDDVYWVISKGAYEHTRYLQLMESLTKNLYFQKRYNDIVQICYQALKIDMLDEELHYQYIKALLAQGKYISAKKEYEDTCDILNRRLGISPTEHFRELYDEIIREEHGLELDMANIQKMIQEKSDDAGAYVCDYELFLKTCELETRRARRTGQRVFIGLITVAPAQSKIVKTVLADTLRSGDMIAQYSTMQLVTMLSAGKKEDADLALNRVRCNVHKKLGSMDAFVKYRLEEVE